MKYRRVSFSEFRSAARKRPAPLHAEAITEATLILAVTLALVTVIEYALRAVSGA